LLHRVGDLFELNVKLQYQKVKMYGNRTQCDEMYTSGLSWGCEKFVDWEVLASEEGLGCMNFLNP
jgi:hypothetical protein